MRDTVIVSIILILITLIMYFLHRTFTSNIKKDIEIKKINDMLDKFVVFSKTDIDGRITYVSSALEKLCGYSYDELKGNTFSILTHEDMDRSTFKELWETISLKKTWRGQLKNRSKDGSAYWLDSTITPDIDHYGNIIGYIAYSINITNLINLEKEKLKTQEALEFRSKFLSNMSHEIRTPLNGIVGLIQVAKKTKLDSNQKDILSKIDSTSHILLGVINDILDISKIESGKMTIEKEPFNLTDTVDNVYNMLLEKASQKSISLDVNYNNLAEFDYIGDSLRISQILTNLLNNAIKFTSEGGVTINVTGLDDNMVKFEVKDTGIGLKEEQLQNLFEEFTQADMSTSRKYGGTGLGLSISKNLVEIMGGKIDVTSVFGEGSTFSFEIPLTVDAQNRITKNKKLQELNRYKEVVYSVEGIKILVAEDNKMNQTVLTMLLEDSKLKLDFADDGKIAVDKFSKEHYDVILMDIQMPNMNGYDATRLIREENKDIPIVGLSANAMREDVLKAKEHGMNDYIAKPIDIDEFCRVVYKYLPKQ